MHAIDHHVCKSFSFFSSSPPPLFNREPHSHPQFPHSFAVFVSLLQPKSHFPIVYLAERRIWLVGLPIITPVVCCPTIEEMSFGQFLRRSSRFGRFVSRNRFISPFFSGFLVIWGEYLKRR